MSELIHKNDSRATIRWKLLTGASVLALGSCVAFAGAANAEDADRPVLWIEFGGQMDLLQGLNAPFTAPFMTAITPTPGVYGSKSFAWRQRSARFAFGEDGKITFQPEDSDWIFSASLRYGRSHANRHQHYQATAGITAPVGAWNHPTGVYHFGRTQRFSDTTAPTSEHHLVLDFSVGKDVGLGLLGRSGTSDVSAGVRTADFADDLGVTIYARPKIKSMELGKYGVLHNPRGAFTEYTLTGHAERSFQGIGPSLSWNASAALAGNAQDGELMFDWGIGAAVLFGRQKAKVDHRTVASYYNPKLKNYHQLYPPRSNQPTRSRNVAVTNIGGFAGLSAKYPNVKISIGYRYDTFLKAMDAGIDTARKSNLTFSGPYASISIGVGD